MDNNVQPQVTEDGLQKSLDDLLKAADAEKTVEALSKAGKDSEMDGTKVSTSGHVDERGVVGGGMAGSGDIGGLSNGNSWETKMMIAKMVSQGILTPGPSFMGFMKKKDDEEGEESEEYKEIMAGKAGGGFIPDLRPSPTAKSEDGQNGESFQKSFEEDPAIAEAIDASDFMEALTKRSSEGLDKLAKSLNVRDSKQADINRAQAAATYEMGKLVKSQVGVINALGERLGYVEKQPAPAKGATSLTGAAALQKSMTGEAGALQEGEQLSKSQVAGVLTYMNLQKGISEMNGEKTGHLATLAEAGGVVAESTLEGVSRFLATNPNEAEQARKYR